MEVVYGKRVLRRHLLLLFTLLSVCCAQAQTANVKVQILNSPPSVSEVRAYPAVKSQGVDVAWCTASVEDLNSFRDVKSTEAKVGLATDSGQSYERASELELSRQTTAIKGFFVFGFFIDSQAPPGTWRCVVDAQDGSEESATNRSSFVLYPKSCGNNQTDEGEEGPDCGGPCMPCSCFNGVKDMGEGDVDCGGQCGYCVTRGALTMTSPSEVYVGDTAVVQVKDGGRGVACLARATTPSGETITFRTDDSGVWNLKPDEAGVWNIRADLYPYSPAMAEFQAKSDLKTYVIAGGALIAAAAVAAYIWGKSRRSTSSP